MSQTHLLNVLRSHQTNLTEDDVLWAFESPKTAAAVTEYIEKHLTPQTLLSFEELAIYQHLQKTGAAPKIHLTNHSPVPQTEPELAAEIAALDAATAQLHTQTAYLRAQKTAYEHTRSRLRSERERRKKAEAARRRKWAGEQEELSAAVQDLVSLVTEEAADLRGTLAGAADVREVGRVLERDDRALRRLEVLAGALVVPQEGGEREELARVETLVQKLAEVREQEIRVRLDGVYLEGRMEEEVGFELPAEPEELREMQLEIDALYSEIPTVARGAAYTEFFQPLLDLLEVARRSRGENWAVGGEYICAVLEHLTRKNDAVASLLRCTRDRDLAVHTLLATLEREAAPPASPPLRPATPEKPLSRRSRSPTKFGRTAYLTPARRRGDLALSKTENPELALLSQLGMSLPPPPPESRVPVVTLPMLAAYLKQQTARADALAAGWEGVVGAGWEEARGEAWWVARRLLGELTGGEVVAEREVREAGGMMVRVPARVREGVREVEKGMRELSTVLSAVAKGVERVERAGGDVGGGKREFVARWER